LGGLHRGDGALERIFNLGQKGADFWGTHVRRVAACDGRE
jgi:hypothetical protein